jgi:molybdate transport system substrate-binding protein
MRSRRAPVTVLATALAVALSAVTAAGAQPARNSARITVLAASSLADVLPRIDRAPRYSFAGSDTLAGQIRLGAPGDVFASANTALPEQLHAEGLAEKPVVFTANALVLITPRSNPARIRAVGDLRRRGIKLLVGTESVPIGAYTRRVLHNLSLTAALANVASEESDVRSILGKIALGEADAGFVYATDASSVAGRVRVLPLPARGQPQVRYGIAVLRSTRDRPAAVAFVRRVLSDAGQARLAAAGFERP